MALSLELANWLVSDAAGEPLQRTAAGLAAGENPVRVLTALRRTLTAERAAAVLQTATLRRAAAVKFSRGAEMWFTPVGLEQATGERVARYKAARFAGHASQADLCCGIGGDALELARHGVCAVVDLDPVTLCFALANLRLHGYEQQPGTAASVESLEPGRWQAVHIDPDRRAGGRRTSSLEFCSPGPTELARWVAASAGLALKLAPATELPEDWAERAEREWLGFDRECKQQVVWFGDLAEAAGRRVATVIDRDGVAERFVGAGSPADSAAVPPQLDAYLLDPHPVLRGAQLSREFAAQLRALPIDSTQRIFTLAQPHGSRLARCFRVLGECPPRRPQVEAWLQKLSAAKPEIKAPGAPEQLVKPLQAVPAFGRQPLTLVLRRVGEGWRCILAEPVTQSHSS